ncbi:MAG: PSD1 and planctomycete cytochrome C domain-containing protein [Opitutaceae bacterium]
MKIPKSFPSIVSVVLTAIFLAAGCGKRKEAQVAPDLPELVGFNEHIRPIFTKNCAACHGGVKKSGGLSYVFEEEAIAVGLSGNQSIVRGNPDASYLIEKVSSKDPEFRMPPVDHGPALKDREIGLLRKWIEQGAEWEEHWAFTKPAMASDGVEPSIDTFVNEKLEAEGLQQNDEADRGSLLRRLSLDLTGVLPTEQELEVFLKDTKADAYEKQVDRLLASSRYGERWATLWLDLARYADSKGAGQDGPRTIYKFRDWVIRAFNADMPFDDFTIKQIAGDLLPQPTFDDFIATAFHRNTHTEDEGGTDDEEFRVVALMDRVNTTWQVWHGTTFACVQCHSHPYDPFRHDEYFKFAAFFNNTQDADTSYDHPVMKFPKDEAKQVELGDLISRRESHVFANWKTSHELAQATEWSWLEGFSVTTDKDDQLSYSVQRRDGRDELIFKGTPTYNIMNVVGDVPITQAPIEAIRIDASPLDLDKAPYQPSIGFKIEKLKIFHVSAKDQQETKLPFDRIFKDEPFSFLWGDPKKDQTGFGAYTRIFRPRYAVFRLKDPQVFEEGDHIRLEIHHGANGGGRILLLRRGSIGFTTAEEWRSIDADQQWVENEHQSWTLYKQYKDEPSVGIPIMRERNDHLLRGTKTFVRGNWTTLGDEVAASTPASLHAMADTDEPDRLKMAKWLVDLENPLTARVLVSRFWEQLFGVGIVETLEDFGSIGELPSHPELLDYLANQLMHEYDWQMKPLLREIVLSAAYRQSSESSLELFERDPKNRLLARGPRTRMTGEMLRDQVLALSGLLNDEMYGAPIKPPLPEGGWTPSHNASGEWIEHTDDRIFRRSIYVHWQRSSPYPMFTAFDAPMRDLCSDRRINSNTPVQPLFTLNDPAMFRATQAYSKRLQSHSDVVSDNIAYGYRLATAKQIPETTLEELLQLHEEIQSLYPSEEAEMKRLHDLQVDQRIKDERAQATKRRNQLINQAKNQKKDPPADLPDPEAIQRGPEDEFVYNAEMAAYDTVAAVLLNLDEVLNK